MQGLSVGRYLVQFRLEAEGPIPAFSGSMWRGILGMQLKRMSEGQTSCPALPPWLSPDRLYEYFMETPPPPDTPAMRRYPHVPHPFVLLSRWHDPEQRKRPGAPLEVELRLFGRACALANVIILALARGAAGGLGKARAPARLRQVLAIDMDGRPSSIVFEPGKSFSPPAVAPLDVPDLPTTQLSIRFESPLRLQRNGRTLTPRSFSPTSFLMNLVRRYAMLCLFHEERELRSDFKELKRQASQVKLRQNHLSSVHLERYSARQGRTHPLSGIVGECVLDMGQAPDLWPFLWLGQYILAGKGTVFGLGQYRVISTPESSPIR